MFEQTTLVVLNLRFLILEMDITKVPATSYYCENGLKPCVNVEDKILFCFYQDGNTGSSWISLSRGCPKYTATHGTILSERNPEMIDLALFLKNVGF